MSLDADHRVFALVADFAAACKTQNPYAMAETRLRLDAEIGRLAGRQEASEPAAEIELDRYGQTMAVMLHELPVGTKLYPAPPASEPAAPDEREAFERWASAQPPEYEFAWKTHEGREFSDLAWEGWQARAAMAQQPKAG